MKKITYKSSGVDIDKAESFIKSIKGCVSGTLSPSVLQRTGAFGSLFALDAKKYKEPVLVSSTDGVGTKLLVAKTLGQHDTVGIDLVAMNVNDLLCVGAEPLFFLDYIACGRLSPALLKQVVKGIARGCRLSGCALIGGETAEMPGLYKKDDYDLAGFAVGVVDKKKIIDGSRLRPGDRLIGLPSSGLHSNGFSLVRRVFSPRQIKAKGKELIRPTRIYAKEVAALTSRFNVKGIAHITGGAFYDKLTKIVPVGMCLNVNRKSWRIPKIFKDIQVAGKIQDKEMFRTFNMGMGMVFVLPAQDAFRAESFLTKERIKHYRIGEVIKDSTKKIVFS